MRFLNQSDEIDNIEPNYIGLELGYFFFLLSILELLIIESSKIKSWKNSQNGKKSWQLFNFIKFGGNSDHVYKQEFIYTCP